MAEQTEGKWRVEDGKPGGRPPADPYGDDGERLDFNNPFGQKLERVWFDGKVVYAMELGEVDVDTSKVKVAQEYQPVYGVELDDEGKKKGEPERPEGQLNIYDSVPGMKKYSPLWQFNYVVVPRSYKANTLRSEKDCLTSGFEIRRSQDVEN